MGNAFEILKKISSGDKNIVISKDRVIDRSIAETLKKAIAKLQAEMETSTNPYVKYIGEYLIKYISSNPEKSEKFLNKNRTIEKGIEVMKNKAEKKARDMGKKGGVTVMISDQEGFDMVQKYFEYDEDEKKKEDSEEETDSEEGGDQEEEQEE